MEVSSKLCHFYYKLEPMRWNVQVFTSSVEKRLLTGMTERGNRDLHPDYGDSEFAYTNN